MDLLGWIIIIAFFLIAFIGLVYPIIPSVLFILLGFLTYGFFFSFSELGWFFWVIEILFVVLLFAADSISNLIGVKKFGGTKAGMWGSTIGLIIGPFVIPVIGILLGPFIGAVIGELLITKTDLKQAIRAGIGSLVGFLTSIVTKGILQGIMIIIFFLFI